MMKDILIDRDEMRSILVESMRTMLKDSYSSPSRNVVNRVFEEVAPEMEAALRDVLKEVVLDAQFKLDLKEAFRHKVAKQLVGELSGAVEKATSSLKQDPRIKAEMVLAIENIIKEPATPTTESEQKEAADHE
jgi:hypothetical protein